MLDHGLLWIEDVQEAHKVVSCDGFEAERVITARALCFTANRRQIEKHGEYLRV